MKACRFLLAFLALAATFTFCRSARAINLSTYDLDSLIWLSSDIVDVTVQDVQKVRQGDSYRFANVRVNHVYSGNCSPGQILRIDELFLYVLDRRLIHSGDHLVLFLNTATYNLPRDTYNGPMN